MLLLPIIGTELLVQLKNKMDKNKTYEIIFSLLHLNKFLKSRGFFSLDFFACSNMEGHILLENLYRDEKSTFGCSTTCNLRKNLKKNFFAVLFQTERRKCLIGEKIKHCVGRLEVETAENLEELLPFLIERHTFTESEKDLRTLFFLRKCTSTVQKLQNTLTIF